MQEADVSTLALSFEPILSPGKRPTIFFISFLLSLMLIICRWKSIFGAGQQVEHGWINNVTDRESELIKAYRQSPLN